MMIKHSALYLLSISHTFLQPYNQDLRMPKPTMRRIANAGLAYPLDEPLAQTPRFPRNGTASSQSITRQKAITILRDQPEDNIFSYLEFTRRYGSLSYEQYLALCALEGCSDVEIRTLLKEDRKPRETLACLLNYKN